MFDKANNLETPHSALAVSLAATASHTCPDLKAIYLFILKAFFITSVLGWLFIVCPSAPSKTDATKAGTATMSQPHATHMINYAQ